MLSGGNWQSRSFLTGLLQYLANFFCQNPFLAILRLRKRKRKKVLMASKSRESISLKINLLNGNAENSLCGRFSRLIEEIVAEGWSIDNSNHLGGKNI